MIWIAFAVLTALAVLSVLWPLARQARMATREETARSFYTAQIAAIDQDRQSALISAQDAAIAATEAARRVLTGRDIAMSGNQSRWLARLAAVLAMIAIPSIALSLYLYTGLPEMADVPLAARVEALAKSQDINVIVANMETYLAKTPQDGKAWQLLAPVYMRLGRPGDAAIAYGKSLALLGDTGSLRVDYAEALVAEAQGQVTPEAAKSFEIALQTNPAEPKLRFYLGLAAEQAGDREKALEIFRKIAAEAKPGAPYLRYVERHIADLGSAIPAPPASGVAAVAALPDPERQVMIKTMVEGLAARLAQNGQDGDGWLRLIRAFTVLHEDARARIALVDARRAMADDVTALEKVNALASELGVESQ